MSLVSSRKWLRCLGVAAFAWLVMPVVAWGQQPGFAPQATFGMPCAVGCQTHHCPPAFKYTYEPGPHIHWHRGCPHPICNPCDLPHFGYYETCWSPWPFPTSYAHCPYPPPASYIPYPTMNYTTPPGRNMAPQQPVNPGAPSVVPVQPGYEEVPLLPAPKQRF